MFFQPGNIYHVYNRANNKQLLFYSERNYLFFLEKMRKYITPNCSLLAYCLMPNHFHLLVYADGRIKKPLSDNSTITKNVLSEGVRLLLSSYTKAINKQEGRTGNLFQQKTKAKPLKSEGILLNNENRISQNYETSCFDYIHLNPIKARLVSKASDWLYSSYNEYYGNPSNRLCDIEKGIELLGLELNGVAPF